MPTRKKKKRDQTIRNNGKKKDYLLTIERFNVRRDVEYSCVKVGDSTFHPLVKSVRVNVLFLREERMLRSLKVDLHVSASPSFLSFSNKFII